jgi:hypothetical protein
MISTQDFAKKALHDAFRNVYASRPVDAIGYVENWEDNLLDKSWKELIIEDYARGAGKELNSKFCAVHSSSALAANHFARFKKEPDRFVLLGMKGFSPPVFEKRLPTGLRGIPPNLDVYLETDSCIIGIESKLLETLHVKKPVFSTAYSKENLPFCEPQWLQLIEAPLFSKGYLDVAQLVKHYLGLAKEQNRAKKRTILLYLFWEPENADDMKEYRAHRHELDSFTSHVSRSKVEFMAMSYRDLWREWASLPDLKAYVDTLIARYSVKIQSVA